MNYEELMLRAITKANKFKYTAKPNPVVGAIIIQGSEIISEGYHEIYGKNHAEINAIEEAQKHLGKKFEDFSDLSLICTLEPCSHVGKTGSCAEFIVKKGFKKVIIGAIDPNPKVAGRGIKILESNGIEVEYGLFGDLVEKQNKNFFYKHKNNKPYITVKIASSLDGMSHIDTERVFITSESSRNDVQKIRADHDAILTGGNTLRNDDPDMNARVDFSLNQAKKILLTSKPYSNKSKFFKNACVDVFEINDLGKIIDSYKESEICSILVEAGPKLVNSFLIEGIVDELIVYTSAKKLEKRGVNWFQENNAIENYGFKLESSYKIDTDLKEIFKKDG
ncbi:MAG: bifunctional diaminohydroxyphosphoribosylaminopyrimidine deaminase/5-amino-6-(5-phosphoribosylamino)uracil reductase RibD [Gammaproteobacteria bacterium]|nr:MAG: riboflavin biosynthesis protein RibD [Gammaproteobacteria bacterium TMED234]